MSHAVPRHDDAGAEMAHAQALARGELVGLPVRIAATGDPTLAGLAGTVVHETMKTITIEHEGGRAVVGKIGQTFAFIHKGSSVLLDGRSIAYRPEDRIKKARV